MRDILLLCFYFWAITPSLAIAAEGATDGKYSSIAVTALVLLFLYLLWKRRRRKKLKNVSSSNAQIEVCSSYTTKNCPGCGERIPLDCAQCEYCEKKQKNGDTTCSGGVESSARARSHFLSERQNGLGVKDISGVPPKTGPSVNVVRLTTGKNFLGIKNQKVGMLEQRPVAVVTLNH